ncbi:DUF4238 domain-containing protein [Roseateles noduli]|uniref:DUF4238 domain-containing protein n=1 Tax=Roseateles chitinivorans TaxID=2917965 RepID=UPI000B4C8A34|nr:hypothetical protein CDL60_06100 [Roseateles noduli]RZI62523.1 MAG: DUF4238 domain-containing protein [Rubrivivax sp.]
MGTHKEHHFIPRFLLSRWEGNANGRLSAMRWLRGDISEKRYKARSVAKERDLYAIGRERGEPNQVLEREFMTLHVDEPASQVHRAILDDQLNRLTEQQQYAWTLFLVSLALRGPGTVAHVRARGIEALGDELDTGPDDFLDSRGPQPEASLRRYVEKNSPDLLNDFGTRSLPTLIQTSALNRTIFEASWVTRRFTGTSERLLIGDRPLTLFGALNDNFLLYLPVAPDRAFLAFNSRETARRIVKKGDVVFLRELNRFMVEQASVYVYGTDLAHKRLLQARLAKEAADAGLGLGPRPQPAAVNADAGLAAALNTQNASEETPRTPTKGQQWRNP